MTPVTTPHKLLPVFSLPTAAIWIAVIFVTVEGLSACSEETQKQPEPPLEEMPAEPEPVYTDGHWAAQARGIALDAEDFFAIDDRTAVGVSPESIQQDFGLLVLNRPYLESPRVGCVPESEVAAALPRASSQRFIDKLKAERDVSMDRVAVNVELLTPSLDGLRHGCFQRGNPDPRFDLLEHRAAVIDAFVDLADLPNIEFITVGLEMNRYFHLSGGEVVDDYTNWVSLYRDIYAAVKAHNDQVKVGPGISWAIFQRRSVPAIALELALEDKSGLVAFVRAYERTIEPLLFAKRVEDGRLTRTATADFLGVSLVPFAQEEPFRDDPAPTDEVAQAGVLEYYRRMPIAAQGLPVLFVQMDWPVRSSGRAAKKGLFLETVKRATSHVDVAWAAWRRLADLAKEPEQTAPCRSFTSVGYDEQLCVSGMLDEQGIRRSVFEIFTTDP